MKKITISAFIFTALLFTGVTASAQSNKAVDMFKNHINHVVQKVEKAQTPKEKRAIMNASFDHLLTAFKRVKQMKVISGSDRTAFNELQKNIQNRKDELNGANGFERIANGQLNNYAHFVQQNVEQANSTITISVVVLLLIIIIVILIA